MCLISCRPIKPLDGAICAVAPVHALPGMVGSSSPSLLFSKCVHVSFKNYVLKACQVLGTRLALGYVGMKGQVAALLGCAVQLGRQTSQGAAALGAQRGPDASRAGCLSEERVAGSLQKSVGVGGCFWEAVTGGGGEDKDRCQRFECGGGEMVWQLEEDDTGVLLACSSTGRKEPRSVLDLRPGGGSVGLSGGPRGREEGVCTQRQP